MLKCPKEGWLGTMYSTSAIDARKITILKKIITKDRQPLMRYVERKLTLTREAAEWKVEQAMEVKPSKK